MWASTCLTLLIPQLKVIFNKKERIISYITYGLFVIIALNPILDEAMHGFGNPSFRWVFLIVIVNMLVVSKVLDNYQKIDKKVLIITSIVYIAIMLGTFFLAMHFSGLVLSDYTKHFIIVLIFIAFIGICCFLIIKKKIKYVCVLVVIELSLSGLYCYWQDMTSKPDDTYEQMYNVTHVLQTYPGDVVKEVNQLSEDNEDEFIRLYIPLNSVYWNFSHNMSVFYDIKGLMTYDSTYANSFTTMYQMEPSVAKTDSGWMFDITDVNLMTFLNTKYAIVLGSDEAPEGWILIDDDYHFGFQIYENPNYRKLGTTYSKVMSVDEYKNNRDTSLFLDTVIVYNPDEIKEYLSEANGTIENVKTYENHLDAQYISDGDGFMVMTIPYDEGWSLKVDGQEVEYFNVSGGFIGFPVKEGTHTIEMVFVPKGFKEGLILSISASVIFVISFVFTQVKKRLTCKKLG